MVHDDGVPTVGAGLVAGRERAPDHPVRAAGADGAWPVDIR